MSSMDPRTVDPAQPHSAEGHEMSDFSFTSVMWLIPLSAIVLVGFILMCLYWFRGAKDNEITQKQGEYVPTELLALRAHEDEVMASYKILDKEKGRYQIPVARAMELLAQEHQGKPGREWVPITDTYLEGAAFAASAAPAAEDNGIQVENAPEARRGAKPAPAAHGPASAPARNPAEGKGAAHGAPDGSAKGKAEAAPHGKK